MTEDASDPSANPARPSAVSGATQRPSPTAAEGSVLVVDDNSVMRQLFRRALEQAQFKVMEAEGGMRALALLERGRPGLVVLDLMMAGMDGFKFLTRLRARPEWQAIPVVVFTAKPLNDEDRKFLTAHTQHFQRKSGDSSTEVVALARQFLKPSGD